MSQTDGPTTDGKCTEWPQNDLELKKAKGTLYMLKYYPRVPNFTPFCSTIARFPDNWGFWFLHRLQWWIWYFRKRFVKNQKLKISKIANVVLWGPLGGNFRTNLKTFGCDIVGGLKFSLPLGPMLMKMNFKNPKCSLTFVRTIRKKIQEKFENLRLPFVGVAFWNFVSHTMGEKISIFSL